MAILNEAITYGRAHGRLILKKISRQPAPSDRMYWISSTSTDCSPRAVLMTIGKNAISAAITTFGVRPKPNQMRKRGASAIFGSTWADTRNGYVSSLIQRE